MTAGDFDPGLLELYVFYLHVGIIKRGVAERVKA
jgi:hypothetical protein